MIRKAFTGRTILKIKKEKENLNKKFYPMLLHEMPEVTFKENKINRIKFKTKSLKCSEESYIT